MRVLGQEGEIDGAGPGSRLAETRKELGSGQVGGTETGFIVEGHPEIPKQDPRAFQGPGGRDELGRPRTVLGSEAGPARVAGPDQGAELPRDQALAPPQFEGKEAESIRDAPGTELTEQLDEGGAKPAVAVGGETGREDLVEGAADREDETPRGAAGRGGHVDPTGIQTGAEQVEFGEEELEALALGSRHRDETLAHQGDDEVGFEGLGGAELEGEAPLEGGNEVGGIDIPADERNRRFLRRHRTMIGHLSAAGNAPMLAPEAKMITLIVNIRVRPDSIGPWRAATLQNVGASRKEAGILSFDLLADRDDPTRFALVERYRDEAAMAAHRATAHFANWVAKAEPLQAEPRSRAFYLSVEE